MRNELIDKQVILFNRHLKKLSALCKENGCDFVYLYGIRSNAVDDKNFDIQIGNVSPSNHLILLLKEILQAQCMESVQKVMRETEVKK